MRKHDFYKAVVFIAAFCVGVFFLAGRAKAYLKEEKIYGFYIQSDRNLTAELVEEFRKLSGICRFHPKDTVSVTISLDSYTLQTVLEGVEFGNEKMRFSFAEQSVMLGNLPELIVGEDVFSLFMDKNGFAPLKSQIDKWKENYRSLVLTMIDENGRERKGKICGIVKRPDNRIYMDKKQMYEVFGKEVHITGGYMEIYGLQNTKKAKNIFEQAGFLTEETDLEK